MMSVWQVFLQQGRFNFKTSKKRQKSEETDHGEMHE